MRQASTPQAEPSAHAAVTLKLPGSLSGVLALSRCLQAHRVLPAAASWTLCRQPHLRCGQEGASLGRTPVAAAPPPTLTPALRLAGAAPPAVRHRLLQPQLHGQSCWQPQGLRQDPGWADSTHTGAPWSWRAAAFAAGLRRSSRWLSGHGHCQRPLGCTPGQAVTGELSCCLTAAPAPHSTGIDTLKRCSRCRVVCCAASASGPTLVVRGSCVLQGSASPYHASIWQAANKVAFDTATDCSICRIANCKGAAASVRKQTFSALGT